MKRVLAVHHSRPPTRTCSRNTRQGCTNRAPDAGEIRRTVRRLKTDHIDLCRRCFAAEGIRAFAVHPGVIIGPGRHRGYLKGSGGAVIDDEQRRITADSIPSDANSAMLNPEDAQRLWI